MGYEDSFNFAISGFTIFALLLIVFAGSALWSTVKIVPQGFNYTVESFGRYTRTLAPGLHILIPVVERVGHYVNMKEKVIDIPSQDVITRDNAMVRVDGVAFFQVLNAAKSAYEVENLEIAIVNLTMTNIRTVMGSMDLDELLSNRDQINAKLLHVVDAATEAWGVKVTRIEIKDIAPPRDLIDSMARQMKAEREKRAQILESEGLRQAAILKAEGEKQAVVLEPKAAARPRSRMQKRVNVQPKPKPRLRRSFLKPLPRANVQAINYFVANNYIRALETLAASPNQKVIMMPLEASSVIGSLAGLAQIAQEPSRRAAETASLRAAAACRELSNKCRTRAASKLPAWVRAPTTPECRGDTF